jgi:hypothetical protein
MLACDGAAERNCSTILLDVSAVNGERSVFEHSELGRIVAEYCLAHGWSYHVATLGSKPVVTGIGTFVASNRGLGADCFTDRLKALEWLNAFAGGLSRAHGNHES